ncbi:sodium:calcium antiporter [Rubinisphaera margarita]|uniref:sodium:calcium antiporter n=1 Tax=Rubinisphaera margarita TaxID=2909586 RepID=UPI001EE8A261|nr:sodium:calcium antiporter [Rubinisphaera margarita]MCG6154606.1 sodium:calcium antiporter [Rubinisphaera margarita]
MTFDFHTYSPWINLLILFVGGLLVWRSGTKLSHIADQISERSNMSKALAGALLLGGATSLPEIATTVTASWLGNASLAMNNLFGGVAMQLAVLALIDFWVVKGALTYFSPSPVLLLGGTLLILQIAVGVCAISAGDVTLFAHIGFWPLLLGAVYAASLYYMNRFENRESWVPTELPEALSEKNNPEENASDHASEQGQGTRLEWGIWIQFAYNCLFVLIGGFLVSATADALSEQTGLSGGFLGATLVALTTSLPEISTTAGAIRLGSYTMAISNIFGTNSLEVALLLPSDLAFRAGPVVNAVDQSALFMGGIGIVLTALYMWGLLERRDRTLFGMGIDSVWVTLVYVAGLIVFYFRSV